jgi:hypothetical protein
MGYVGLYEVSDLGRVRSLDRVTIVKRGPRQGLARRYQGRLLTPALACGGRYWMVTLSSGGVYTHAYVHDLVLRAFVGPPPPNTECCHGPEGSLENKRTNLSWGTRSTNMLDKNRDGTDYHRNLLTCPLGHLLQMPNLIPSAWALGYRGCLACNRARTMYNQSRRQGKSYDFETNAHRYYANIMRIAAN